MTPEPTSALGVAAARARATLLAAPFVNGPADEAKALQYLDGLVESSRRLATSVIDQPVFVRPIGPIDQHGDRFMKAGLDNPDNDYWQAEVRPGSVYVIDGQRGTTVDLNLQLLDGSYAEHADRLAASLGTLTLADLEIEADGSWSVTLGGDDRGGNHLALAPTASTIFVRETWADWATEQRGSLSIRKIAGPDHTPTDESHDEMAARFLRTRVDLWLQFGPGVDATVMAAAVLQGAEPNVLIGPLQTPSGLDDQYSASGRFAIARDQALVITLHRAGAPYVAIQLGDDFFTSLDYADRSTCLNHAQAITDTDGAIRVVVAHTDPGIANWLDTTGRHCGYLFCRWQGLTPDRPPPTPTVDVVALSDVVPHLGDTTATVSPAQRADAQRRRAHGMSHRRAALPDCD